MDESVYLGGGPWSLSPTAFIEFSAIINIVCSILANIFLIVELINGKIARERMKGV